MTWLPVVGWSGWYEVCDRPPQVRSVDDRLIVRSDGRRIHATGKVLRQHEGSVILQRPGQRRHVHVCVLVRAAFGDGEAA
jgi:hypothetical protein